jgi:hypothetical protein
MRISLNSPVRKTAFLGAGAVLLISFCALSLQSILGWWFSRNSTLQGYQRAALLDPWNAEYLLQLGNATQVLNYDQSIGYLERAVRENPNSARAWLSLAGSYALTNQPQKQRQAVLKALAVAPKDTDVEWEAANLFLIDGDDQTALRLMRDVVSGDDSRSIAAMQTVYHVSDGNVQKTISALPATAKARLSLMYWLISHDHPSEADSVWPSVMAATDKFSPIDPLFYLDSLIDRHEVSRARAVLSELAGRDPALARRIETGNVLVNGGFEENLIQRIDRKTGFDWRWDGPSGVTVDLDTSIFHSGSRSLGLTIDSANLADAGIHQLTAVEPGARYSLRAFTRSEELESAHGLRLAVLDHYSNQVLFLSDEVLGTLPWREIDGEFEVPSSTQLIRVCFVQSPAVGIIRGRVWFDDIRLEKR